MSKSPTPAPIAFSCDMHLDGYGEWLAVCSDTSGFVADNTGRVVPADSAGEGSQALQQPCIFASLFSLKKHLKVVSLDGSQRLRCHISLNWDHGICGLHCDRQLLYIAQYDAVTVADLGGRVVRQIQPPASGFEICGIGGNADSLFVSGGNRIAAFNKQTGQKLTIITLSHLPDARLHNMAVHKNSVLVTDWKNMQVHRVRIDKQQLVASHPTDRSGLKLFANPQCVAVDSRGRLFVSEYEGHCVRVLSPDDGTLLLTLGIPGDNGAGHNRFDYPAGLAVLKEGHREQLAVADSANRRLVLLKFEP